MSRIVVPEARLVEHARTVLRAADVPRSQLALAFEGSVAATAQLHVEGRNFNADAGRHCGCVVVGAHQSVRFSAWSRRGSFRGRPDREGAGGRSGPVEIDVGFVSTDLAAQVEERFAAPAEEISSDLQPPTTLKRRARAAAFAALSPLL